LSDTTKRSIAKTISWRIIGSGATFVIGYAVVGDITASATIALIQVTFSTLLYFAHERVWSEITWGA